MVGATAARLRTVSLRCRWVRLGATLLFALILPSCLARHEKPLPGPPFLDPLAILQARARQLWTAKMHEDWDTAFLFEDPRTRENVDPAEFVAWCKTSEPFRVRSFDIGQALIDGEMGWVEISCRTSVTKFPNAPPQDIDRWEKWRTVDGQWYPVPRTELDAYPISPALRDVDEEARLQDRFEESWAQRQARDWGGLFAMTDPHDRAEIQEDQFARAHQMVEFLSKEVQWVQIVCGEGIVRVAYRHKTTDPSLTKLPQRWTYVSERWVDRDGEWYLDLKTQ